MKAWWLGLEPRERRTLVLGGAALLVVLFYFLLWLPPHREADALRERIASQRADLAWMEQAALQVGALRGRQPTETRREPSQALYALADRTAREAGLGDAIQRVEPSGEGRVRVSLREASFDALLSWLGGLRGDYGIEAEPVSARAADTPGLVDVQLVLKAPGA